MVQETQQHSNDNNVIKFEDNSSAIRGFCKLSSLIPYNPCEASLMSLNRELDRHIIFTAETHNFPTGVAPFQGATTGLFPGMNERVMLCMRRRRMRCSSSSSEATASHFMRNLLESDC
jgi:phosphoribosylformylglycinamidine (FGAM) synthase-like enzyme